jgi:hypothetical protein
MISETGVTQPDMLEAVLRAVKEFALRELVVTKRILFTAL